MIEGNQYIKVVKSYFEFLLVEYGFVLSNEKVKGNAFYEVRYQDKKRIVSISYENIENYLMVIIFILQNGQLPDYDDKTKTLHLNVVNEIILKTADKNEIILNNEYFSKFKGTTELERKLLKSARELRLCLKHFHDIYTL